MQIGYLNGEVVSIHFCLAAPEDDWSAIASIGIVPSHRKRSLGLQVHRHGIATLRALGGVTYHDGTSESNEARRPLFAKWGRLEYARMGERHAAVRLPCAQR